MPSDFEKYARRIIDALPAPDPVPEDQLLSPLENTFRNLEGELLTISDTSSNISELFSDETNTSGFDEEAVENGILASGMDALAIYKSIHYLNNSPFPGHWGIFIFDYALRYLEREIDQYYPGKYSLFERTTKSFRLLYSHERFHFRFDCWALSHESSTQLPLYENYRNSIYRTFHPQIFVYEETLANLHALSSIATYGIASFAKSFMLSQPGAYSNIISVDRNELLGKLAAQTFHKRSQIVGVPFLTLPEHIPFIANPRNTKNADSSCPVYIVQEVSPSVFSTPGLALPTLKEMEHGFVYSYLNGECVSKTDHKYYRIDNGEKVKFPNVHRKNVRLCEFSNIIKKAGLVQKEFYDERERTHKWKKYTPREEIKPSLLEYAA